MLSLLEKDKQVEREEACVLGIVSVGLDVIGVMV